MSTPTNKGQGVGQLRVPTSLDPTEQTADHITSGRPPEEINGLIDLGDETRTWLENNALYI